MQFLYDDVRNYLFSILDNTDLFVLRHVNKYFNNLIGNMKPDLTIIGENGYLNLLKWITQNYQLSNTSMKTNEWNWCINWCKIKSMYKRRFDDVFLIYSRASATNHLDILRYMHRKFNYTSDDHKFILYIACISGHIDILKWLDHEMKFNFFHNNSDYHGVNEIGFCAVKYRHYDILKWLCRHSTFSNNTRNELILESIRKGQLKMLKWLVTNISDGEIKMIGYLEPSVENKWYDILEFAVHHSTAEEICICTNHCNCDPNDIFDWILKNGYENAFLFCESTDFIIPSSIMTHKCSFDCGGY
jgi:hypothetical protein